MTRGNRIRIPRILSTSTDRDVAVHPDHCKDLSDEVVGYLLVIQIPKDFWGARVVSDISLFDWEEETIFPPYSQFEVLHCCGSSPPEIHLLAIDKYAGF